MKCLFRQAMAYGPHATGIVARHKPEEVELWKKAVDVEYVLRNHNHRFDRMTLAPVGIGHTRYGTHGDTRSDRNAHPFTTEKGTHFVHNGVITNYKKLMPSAVVDSECLGPLIESHEVGRAHGSVGLAWFEKIDGIWTPFAYRHSQGLIFARLQSIHDPAHYGVVVVSRPSMLSDFQNPKNGYRVTGVYNIPEGTACRVTPETLSAEWTTNFESRELATTRGGVYCGG